MEGLGRVARPPIQDPGLLDLHRADPRQQRPLGQLPVANDLAMPVGVGEVLLSVDPLGDLGFDGLPKQLLGALPKDTGQHVATAGGWQRNRGIGNLSHGGVLLGKLAISNQTQPQLRRRFQLNFIHNFLS